MHEEVVTSEENSILFPNCIVLFISETSSGTRT